jgi:hypothetical protein
MATDASVAALLAGVIAQNDDVNPAIALFGAGATSEQTATAEVIARRAYRDGLIAPTMQPYDDLIRVRVTAAGRSYLAEHRG